jgi:putative inorganic carbon (HCO3(-)) transporter
MRTDRRTRQLRESRRQPPFATTVPVFVGLVTGGALVVLSDSRLVTLIGLAIVGLTFAFSGMWAVKRVLLAIIVIEIPIQVDIYLNHDLTEAATAALSGYNISVTTLSLVALYGIWISELVAGAAPSPLPILKRAAPAIVYMVVVVASLFVATDTDLVFYEATILLQALLVMIYVAHAVQTRRDVLFVLGLLIVGILLQFGVSLLTFAVGSAVEIGVVTTGAIGSRVAGTLGHPNSLGGYLAMLLPVSAALVMAPVASWYRWLAGSAFVTGTVLLGLSQSRGGFLGYMVGLAVLAALLFAYRLVPRKVLARGALLAMVPLTIQVVSIAPRLIGFDDLAARSRLPLVGLAITMIGDNAVFGVGANNFAAALEQYLTIDYNVAWLSTVHNRYLLVWAETGVVGLAVFLWFLLSMLRRALGVVRIADRTTALVAAGLFAGTLASMVHMTVDIYHNRPLVQLLWLIAGLLIAIERLPALRTSDGVR